MFNWLLAESLKAFIKYCVVDLNHKFRITRANHKPRPWGSCMVTRAKHRSGSTYVLALSSLSMQWLNFFMTMIFIIIIISPSSVIRTKILVWFVFSALFSFSAIYSLFYFVFSLRLTGCYTSFPRTASAHEG